MTKGTPNENSFNIDEKGRGLKLRNRNFVSFFGNLWNRHITKRHYKNPISWLLTFSAMTLTCDYIMCHSHFSSSRAAPTKRGISSQGPFFSLYFLCSFYQPSPDIMLSSFFVDSCFCIFSSFLFYLHFFYYI